MDDPPRIPDGFTAVGGEWKPRTGEWHILLRCGFCDTRIAYTPAQLRWTHDGGAGDVVAVKRVE